MCSAKRERNIVKATSIVRSKYKITLDSQSSIWKSLSWNTLDSEKRNPQCRYRQSHRLYTTTLNNINQSFIFDIIEMNWRRTKGSVSSGAIILISALDFIFKAQYLIYRHLQCSLFFSFLISSWIVF